MISHRLLYVAQIALLYIMLYNYLVHFHYHQLNNNYFIGGKNETYRLHMHKEKLSRQIESKNVIIISHFPHFNSSMI